MAVATTNWTTFPYDTPRTSWSFPFVLPGTRQDRACKGHPAENGGVETLEHGQKTAPSRKGIHPRNLTWNLKISPWKRKVLLETMIFRFHVKFRGCTLCQTFLHATISTVFWFQKKGRHSLQAGVDSCWFFTHTNRWNVSILWKCFARTVLKKLQLLWKHQGKLLFFYVFFFSGKKHFISSHGVACGMQVLYPKLHYFSCFRVRLGSVSPALFSHRS